MYCEICGLNNDILILQRGNKQYRCQRHNKQSFLIEENNIFNHFSILVNPKKEDIVYYLDNKEYNQLENINVSICKREICIDVNDIVSSLTLDRKAFIINKYLELKSLINSKIYLNINLNKFKNDFLIEFYLNKIHELSGNISINIK